MSWLTAHLFSFIQVRFVEDDTDTRFQPGRLFDHVAAGHRRIALIRIDLSGEHADRSAFAGAIWAKQKISRRRTQKLIPATALSAPNERWKSLTSLMQVGVSISSTPLYCFSLIKLSHLVLMCSSER
jgi:hypothetical protein